MEHGRASAPWPLVGRDAELQDIALARRDGGCRGIVVSAGAGVGKSRLAREAYLAAERDGALVDWVQATSSAATVPLGAFAGLIPPDARSDNALELMRQSTDMLVERAHGRKIVLSVDDAQLLDPVSAALVLHLTSSASTFVIATVRSGEPCPDAIVSLWKDAGARRIELQRLSDEAVETLVETALGGPVEQAALRWVVDSSQGNALYVRELVSAAVDAGTLQQSRGLWRLSGRPAVSAPLADLVSRRMAGLGDAERAALELLAVGEPLELDEIALLADYAALVEAEARGLVVVDAGGATVRLAHPLYGEVLRRELPVLRARQLRLWVAETLQQRRPVTPDDALRVARLRLDAGAEIPADLLVDAARAANLAGDPDLGAQLAETALEHGPGLRPALLLARAHTVRKRFADAEDVLAAAADAGRSGRRRRRLPRAARPRAVLGPAPRGRDPRPARGRRGLVGRRRLAAAARAGAAHLRRDRRRLRRLDRRAPRPARRPELDARTRRMAERRLALSLFFAGRMRESYALARHVQPSVPLDGYSDALALGLWRLLGFETGEDRAGFEADMTATLRDAVRVSDHEAAGHGAFGLGYLHFLAGRHRDAARWFAEADLHFEQQDTFGTLIHVRALRVGVDVFTGDRQGAVASLERLRATLAGSEPVSSQAAYVARAEGWAARLQSERAAAEQLLRDATRFEAMPVYATQLVYEALRAGVPAITAAAELASSPSAATVASSPRTSRTRTRSPRATARRCSRSPTRWRPSARSPTASRPRSPPPGSSSTRAARTPPVAPLRGRASCTCPSRGPRRRPLTASTARPSRSRRASRSSWRSRGAG